VKPLLETGLKLSRLRLGHGNQNPEVWSWDPLTDHYQWFGFDPATRQLTETREEVQGIWTIVYGPDGIRAKSAQVEIELTDDGADCCAYVIDDSGSFVYLDKTGKTIADGSGYEWLLTKVEAGSGEKSVVLQEQQQWNLLGRAGNGHTLLVDHAFNEGADRNYANLYLVDLKNSDERPLADGMSQTGLYFDAVYSEEAGLIAFNEEHQLNLYHLNGHKKADFSVQTDTREHVQHRNLFTPDGSRLIYYAGGQGGSGEGSAPLGRIYTYEILGGETKPLTLDPLPVASQTISPSGQTLFITLNGGFAALLSLS
jgi:hypothetical protein